MKAVILAGGLGTRLSEETTVRPKPLVEVGGHPVLWHIMKVYGHYGVTEFTICCGYKGYMIKEYFANYALHRSDITIDLQSDAITVHRKNIEPWKVTLIDTGDHTMTGGRLLRLKEHLKDEEAFHFTYGDGVANIDVGALEAFHKAHGGAATVTAVQPPGRFGSLSFAETRVTGFKEKPDGDGGWVNGGFFVLSPQVFEHIDGDSSVWEAEPLEALARGNQLHAYFHDGFWKPMDTLRDRTELQRLWETDTAPWRVWR